MNYHIAARMDRMAPSGIRKVNEKALAMERAGEKVLHFEIGRPDFDTPEYIKKAADQAIAEGKVHYTSNFGLMELRQAIADKLQRENHVDYKASEVLVTVGLSEAVFAVLAALLDEGDELLVPDPVWLNYINVPNLLGAKAVTYRWIWMRSAPRSPPKLGASSLSPPTIPPAAYWRKTCSRSWPRSLRQMI